MIHFSPHDIAAILCWALRGLCHVQIKGIESPLNYTHHTTLTSTQRQRYTKLSLRSEERRVGKECLE